MCAAGKWTYERHCFPSHMNSTSFSSKWGSTPASVLCTVKNALTLLSISWKTEMSHYMLLSYQRKQRLKFTINTTLGKNSTFTQVLQYFTFYCGRDILLLHLKLHLFKYNHIWNIFYFDALYGLFDTGQVIIILANYWMQNMVIITKIWVFTRNLRGKIIIVS